MDVSVANWAAWRPPDVARLLAGVDVPWYVAGGWALDLFLGAARREHQDLEIAVPNARFGEVAEALGDFDLFVITGPNEAEPLASASGRLAETHQTWARERATGKWRFDVFREPSEDGVWVCRRDASLRMPYAEVVERTADGIPYGRPEVVLLFKAKRAEEAKNADDFEAVLPRLDAQRRAWLRGALDRVHPGHAWLVALDAHS